MGLLMQWVEDMYGNFKRANLGSFVYNTNKVRYILIGDHVTQKTDTHTHTHTHTHTEM